MLSLPSLFIFVFKIICLTRANGFESSVDVVVQRLSALWLWNDIVSGVYSCCGSSLRAAVQHGHLPFCSNYKWIKLDEDIRELFFTCLLKRMLSPPKLVFSFGIKIQVVISFPRCNYYNYIYLLLYTYLITFAPNVRLQWIPSRFIMLVKFASRRTIVNTYYIFTDPRIKGFNYISQLLVLTILHELTAIHLLNQNFLYVCLIIITNDILMVI